MTEIDRKNVTTHAGIAHSMRKTLESYGCNSDALFQQVGLDTVMSDDRVQAIAMQQLWRLAVVETGDEGFGLRFAQQLQPAALHGLGFSWMASSTLFDAFERLVRYYRIISTAGEIVLEQHDQRVRLWYKIPAPAGRAAPASLDAALAVFVQLCRLTKSADFSPVRVELQREVPVNKDAFSAFFASDVIYQAAENCLFFDLEELNQPLVMASPELARVNDQIVIDYLKRHDSAHSGSQVRACIIDLLPSGPPSQELVASTLNMSSRTLQRRLSAENQTFKLLLEEVRFSLAKQYLQETGRSVSEVTYLLGFSEPSNFARAFKRWAGVSPTVFQNRSL